MEIAYIDVGELSLETNLHFERCKHLCDELRKSHLKRNICVLLLYTRMCERESCLKGEMIQENRIQILLLIEGHGVLVSVTCP